MWVVGSLILKNKKTAKEIGLFSLVTLTKNRYANFGVILELITYSDVNIDIETKRK
jgi:hypothetical protein